MGTEHTETLINAGCNRLKALAQAMGFDEASVGSMQEVFRTLTESWGDRRAGGTPQWISDACDDNSPYELSVALDKKGKPQLRVLVEPMDSPSSPTASRAAGKRLYDVLARKYGANLERVRALEDLLLPEKPRGPFTFWYAAAFSPGEAPEFKIYFHLQCQGPGRAAAVTEEAMHRVGFGKAWPAIADILRRRPDGEDELIFFALDLSHGDTARVKVYLRHHASTATHIEEVAATARYHRAGSAAEFARQMGGGEGPYGGKGPVMCLAFTDPQDERPLASTIYMPISHYTRHDLEGRERVTRYLEAHGIDAAPYQNSLEACAHRRLDAGCGMHTYAALRYWGEDPRVTVYYSPEVYGTQPPRHSPEPLVLRSEAATDIVEYFENNSIADHPFLARLRREPVDLSKLARILANFRVGITQDFPRRLAWLTARAPNDALRCTLAKQLNDEMGDGDFTRAHRGLFERMLGVLKPWWNPANPEEATAPGRALGEVLEHCYVKGHPYEGIGASLVVEVYGKQVDTFIADEFRRQNQIPPSDLEWLNLHEKLEAEHADESLDMARLIPAAGTPDFEAAWKGARAIATASHTFFDHLYRQCFHNK